MNLPHFEKTALDGVCLIAPARFADERGFFSETYSAEAFRQIGVSCVFVQDNHSLSRKRGTVRGMHFQMPPFAQAKLVRVISGAVYDVAVDLRQSSPDFGRHVGVVLSAENGHQLFIPAGFAHGFCTLEADTEVLYKVDVPFSRDHERGLRWNDPILGIAWPVCESDTMLSERDRQLPALEDVSSCFQ
jgi:dTDP-4-dehydrorhamnose 3,5-epimerase